MASEAPPDDGTAQSTIPTFASLGLEDTTQPAKRGIGENDGHKERTKQLEAQHMATQYQLADEDIAFNSLNFNEYIDMPQDDEDIETMFAEEHPNSQKMVGMAAGMLEPPPTLLDMLTTDLAEESKEPNPSKDATKDVVMKLFNFATDEDFVDWLRSYSVKTWFFEFWKNHLAVEHQKKADNGGQRARGTHFALVQSRLTEGENGGRARFSIETPDTSSYDMCDHYARFLFKTIYWNRQHNEGIWFR
ncbi:hypothetical protein GX50_09030, partial [[Emmonsia] crescens]